MNKTIAVALSGGVDSATTAYLLKNKGHEVFGITMKVHDSSEVNEAKKVADILGIRHYVVDYRDYFQKEIIQKFVDMYLQGETPNPCVMCNQKLKYGKLLEDAMALGADAMALGHYASIFLEEDGCYHLRKASAERKDQSYVLYHLRQKQLERVILPLNDFQSKEDVREILAKEGLEIAKKKDSVGICFTEGKSVEIFIKEQIPECIGEGNFVDCKGNVLGKHRGIFAYTIGQKRGLNIADKHTYFVREIRSKTNEVVLTKDENELYKNEVKLTEISFTNEKYYQKDRMRVAVKMFQWGYELLATLRMEGESGRIIFDQPERAPTKGQIAVFYINDEVIGGGRVCDCF